MLGFFVLGLVDLIKQQSSQHHRLFNHVNTEAAIDWLKGAITVNRRGDIVYSPTCTLGHTRKSCANTDVENMANNAKMKALGFSMSRHPQKTRQ